MSLELLTPPAVEPLLLSEVKDHLRVVSTTEDALITEWIVAARLYAERVMKRALITQQVRWKFCAHCLTGIGFHNRVIPLPIAPVQSIDSVQFFDENDVLQPFTDFESDLAAEPALIWSDSWPQPACRPDAAQITFTAGYGDAGADVPSLIRSALKLHIGDLYENRENAVSKPPQAVNDIYGRYTFRRAYA